MKTIGLLFFLLLNINLENCSQNKNNESRMEVINKQKTDLDMLNIFKSVKKYNYNPRYLIDFSSTGCTYHVLIDDVEGLVISSPGNIGGAVEPINGQLLKSGKHKIKVIITPPRNQEWELENFLTEHSSLKFTIKHGEFGKDKMENYKVVYEFVSPKVTKGDIPFLEFEGAFNVELPYVLEGWSNSEDLTKRPNLEAEVVKVYNKYRDILVKKDLQEYSTMMYKKEVEVAQAFFWNTEKDSKERWADIVDEINKPGTYEPIENYKLHFYANGKIVKLLRSDNDYKGEPVIRRIQDGRISANSIYLHMPKGSNKLEVIR